VSLNLDAAFVLLAAVGVFLGAVVLLWVLAWLLSGRGR
jgi:hypothetical protein